MVHAGHALQLCAALITHHTSNRSFLQHAASDGHDRVTANLSFRFIHVALCIRSILNLRLSETPGNPTPSHPSSSAAELERSTRNTINLKILQREIHGPFQKTVQNEHSVEKVAKLLASPNVKLRACICLLCR